MIEDWIKMGYSEQEAEELHQLCVNVATAGICDIDKYTESLASLVRSYNMSENEINKIIDKWNKIGNKNFD